MALTKKELEVKLHKVTSDYNTLHANYETLFAQRNGFLKEAQNNAAAYQALEKMYADLQRELKQGADPLATPNDFDFVGEYDNTQLLLRLKHHNITTTEAIHELVADSQALNGLFHMVTKLKGLLK
jgi:recombinational DNA repair ATPase RecF